MCLFLAYGLARKKSCVVLCFVCVCVEEENVCLSSVLLCLGIDLKIMALKSKMLKYQALVIYLRQNLCI